MNINDLPEIVLTEIFAHLPGGSIKNVRLVCNRWNELCLEVAVSKRISLCLRSSIYGSSVTEKYISECKWKCLNLKFYGHKFRSSWKIDNNAMKIRSIILQDCVLKKDTFMCIVTECLNLQIFICSHSTDLSNTTEALFIPSDIISQESKIQVCKLKYFKFTIRKNSNIANMAYLKSIYSKQYVNTFLNSLLALFPSLESINFCHPWFLLNDLDQDLQNKLFSAKFSVDVLNKWKTNDYQTLSLNETESVPSFLKELCFMKMASNNPISGQIELKDIKTLSILTFTPIIACRTLDYCKVLCQVLDQCTQLRKLFISKVSIYSNFELCEKLIKSKLEFLVFKNAYVTIRYNDHELHSFEPQIRNKTLKRICFENSAYEGESIALLKVLSYLPYLKELRVIKPSNMDLHYIWETQENLKSLFLSHCSDKCCTIAGFRSKKRKQDGSAKETLQNLQSKILKLELTGASMVQVVDDLNGLSNLKFLDLSLKSLSLPYLIRFLRKFNLYQLEAIILSYHSNTRTEKTLWLNICENFQNLRMFQLLTQCNLRSNFTNEECNTLFANHPELQLFICNRVIYYRKPFPSQLTISDDRHIEDLGNIIAYFLANAEEVIDATYCFYNEFYKRPYP